MLTRSLGMSFLFCFFGLVYSSVDAQVSGVISDYVLKVDDKIVVADGVGEVEYDAPAKLLIAGKCNIVNNTANQVQFYCTWKLHQAPFTVTSSWDPLLDANDMDDFGGAAVKPQATGDWNGSIKIEYQSGTQTILLDAKTVTFVEKVGVGDGGGVFE